MKRQVKLTPGTTLTDISGKQVLFSVKSGESFGLNETAALMLQLCLEHGPRTAAQQLSTQFDVPADELAGDLDELLQGLAQAGLVQVLAGNQAG